MPLPSALAAIVHLAAMSVIGPVSFAVLSLLLSLSVLLLPALGLGLLFAPVFALALYGCAWLERHRVASLFKLDVPEAPMRTSDRRDGWRHIATLLLQFADGRNWLGILHGAIVTILGFVTISLVQTILGALVIVFMPIIPGAIDNGLVTLFGLVIASDPIVRTLIMLLIVALSLAGLYGLACTHRAISRSFFLPDRERELEQQARESAQRRSEAMHAAEVERSRIERDLHDGVQPRLVSVGMTLGMAKRKIDEDPSQARVLLDEAHASTKDAITELRRLARGFHPAVLEDQGLDAALSALVAASRIPVKLDVRMAGRAAREAEAAMYFAIAESLANIAKHSGAKCARVTVVSRPDGALWGRIEDDGSGGARVVPGGGLDGILNRVRAAGGVLNLSSPQGGPTTIEVSLPCAS